jgi:peptide/nickel transport system permease protein
LGPAQQQGNMKKQIRNWWGGLKSLRRYPSMVAGLLIIFAFIVASLYAVVAVPYSEAIRLWRGGPGVWDENPKTAKPVWFDFFTTEKLSRTIRVTSQDQGAVNVEPLDDETDLVTIELPFNYDYDTFPTELNLFTNASTSLSASIFWYTPDGRVITIREDREFRGAAETYYISQDSGLITQFGNRLPHTVLFTDPRYEERVLKGDYQMALIAEVPQGGELSAKLVVYGEVQGLAGTDHLRRDIAVALLWGAPIGLIFGVLAAVGTTLITFLLSAVGTWLGGKTDSALQWLTQVNLIIPLLPVLIMFGYLYDRSIWTMLGLVIALNIFGSTMLTNRAMFLQAKESPYIEAAQAYGAKNFRIIFRYLMPRIAPTLLPQLVLIVPSFVFLEATLSVLGLGDPVMPTWGKVIYDGYGEGALYKGLYYWMIEPAILLMLLGVGFSLIGYSLDRIFNPRLRTV